MEQFKTFTELTSLHGYQYLNNTSQSKWHCLYWSFCILCSIIGAIFVLFESFDDLENEMPITFQDPELHTLESIYFPGLTVCNVNRVRRSFFEELGIYENETAVNHINDYYMGEQIEKNDQSYHQTTHEILEGLDEGVKEDGDLKRTAHQACADMFLGHVWCGTKHYKSDTAVAYGTDEGMCCMYHPNIIKDPNKQTTDEEKDDGSSTFDWDDWKENKTKGVKPGKEKGFVLLLDVESFDYNGAEVSYEGFHVVVGSYHDQAIINQRAIQITPGTVTQIALTPSLSSITDRALSRFSPRIRQCYNNKEIELTYFPRRRGYMYSLDNCIFESTVNQVHEDCNCYPPNLNFYNNEPCTDEKMTCMEHVYETLSMTGTVTHDNKTKHCRPLCETQSISLFTTSSSYPNENLFVYHKEFCIIAKRLLEKCEGSRRKPLEEMYPQLCETLEVIKNINLDNACDNKQWPLMRSNLPNCTWERCKVEEAVMKYSKDNLVAINIFFPNPFVNRMIRDVKITTNDFIGNVGGLLGLCMGFSVISLAEIVYHILAAIVCLMTTYSKH